MRIPSPSHSLGSSDVLTCTHTLTCPLKCSHIVTLPSRFTLTWPSQTPVLIHAPICLHTLLKYILHNKVTLKAHNHTLAHKYAYTLTMIPPTHTHRHRPLWKDIQNLSHLTLPLWPQAHPLARLHLLAHSSSHSLLHSCCRRILHHGAPSAPPQSAHTYGKLPKVTASPLPLRPRGPSIRLSGSNGGAPRRRKLSPASAMTFDPERRVARGPFERPHVVFKAPSPTGNPSHLPPWPAPGTPACSRCRIEPCPGIGSEARARPWPEPAARVRTGLGSRAGALSPGRQIPPAP